MSILDRIFNRQLTPEQQQDALDNRMLEALNADDPDQFNDELKAALDAGANPNLELGFVVAGTHFPLHEAKTAEHSRLLIEHGADVHAIDGALTTPLHGARSAEQAEVLLAAGADPNARDWRERTPLHNTSEPGVVEVLLDHGAYQFARDSDGVRADQRYLQQWEAEEKERRDEFVQSMGGREWLDQMSARFPVHTRSIEEEETAVIPEQARLNERAQLTYDLVEALEHPHPEKQNDVVRDLLARGSDPNDTRGVMALHSAQTAEHTQMLLDAGADVSVMDYDERTALHVVQDPRQVELLINHGADPTAKDLAGNSPLHTARSTEVAKAMLDQGLDPSSVNDRGQRADENPMVMEARGRELGQQMDQSYADAHQPRTRYLTDDDRAALRMDANPSARDVYARLDAMNERTNGPEVKAEVPDAPKRRRL